MNVSILSNISILRIQSFRHYCTKNEERLPEEKFCANSPICSHQYIIDEA